jgi:hypothetical protein
MKKQLFILTSLILSILIIASCNNNVENKEDTNVPASTHKLSADNGIPAAQQLNEAKANGKVAFFVLISDDTTGNAQAMEIADKVNKLVNNSVVIKINRDDTINAETINKWQLSSIPTPAIFIISARGVPVTSFSLEEANEEAILKDVPSPKMEDAYVALDEFKPVFILVARQSATNREILLSACKTANTQLKKAAVIVEVDQEDPREKTLLDNFNIKADAILPNIIVLNADGETTGRFEGKATAKQLADAATKMVKTQCCANGETCK